MQRHYFWIILVVFRMFEPKQCVRYMLVFCRLLFYTSVREIWDSLLWLLSYCFPCYLIYPFFRVFVCVVFSPLYLTFNLSSTISIVLDSAPVSLCCVVTSEFVKPSGIWSLWSCLLIDTSSSDHRCKHALLQRVGAALKASCNLNMHVLHFPKLNFWVNY